MLLETNKVVAGVVGGLIGVLSLAFAAYEAGTVAGYNQAQSEVSALKREVEGLRKSGASDECALSESQFSVRENASWTASDGKAVIVLQSIDTSGAPVRAVLHIRDATREWTDSYTAGDSFEINISGRKTRMRVKAIRQNEPRQVVIEMER